MRLKVYMVALFILGMFSCYSVYIYIDKQIEIKHGDTCSFRASQLGDHQKIISYCLYGPDRYRVMLRGILDSVRLFYPDWYVRVYTDQADELKELEKNFFDVLYVCDVGNLPNGNLKRFPKIFWRYFSLGDPQVDVVNFRDIDSKAGIFFSIMSLICKNI